MKKTLILLGASTLMLGVLNSGAEARKVHYEIDGKRYSYSTNNIAQTAEAKRRIEAARAVELAKAKVEAEKAKFPLSAAFGSPAQKEATAAQERLQQLLSGKGQETQAAQPVVEDRADRRSKRQGGIREASAAATPQQAAFLTQEPLRPTKVVASAGAPLIAEPVKPQHRAKVKSVSFDVETGIKTTIMIDGTVQEEPFDSSVLSHLAPEQEERNSLTAFVKQLRRIAPEDATGSIMTSVAEPEAPNGHH